MEGEEERERRERGNERGKSGEESGHIGEVQERTAIYGAGGVSV